jgi:hypothetical protein
MSKPNDPNPESGHREDLPWPAVTTDNWQDRVYDHGAAWCDRRDQHPAAADDYPGPDHYQAECRTRGGHFHGGRLDTDGDPVIIEAYAARPFLFGQPRANPTTSWDGAIRLVLSAVPDHQSDAAAIRISLPATEARNLAYHLLHLADTVDGHIQPRQAQPARRWRAAAAALTR